MKQKITQAKALAHRNATYTFMLFYFVTIILNDMFFGIEELDYKFLFSIVLLSMLLVHYVTLRYSSRTTKQSE
ncbi:hypothetical protein SH601_05425 [Gracilibacillus sp. S3-1-1]|uniref:Uncharacterized protein n=1 Tax=Gracilibacillus pellucidus TaxID=3095368 RepID=A0ACC6M3H8_9BACI|nr:hypothetical protein [Gracilibacillus sp. S3-1-1]MDX8045425.1 hypothetical protein [Gracilibacillus sp. S3-1-1]